MNVAILAGGGSTRMGRDKADLPWRDGTLLEHLVGLVREAECRPLVVGRDTAPEGALAIPDEQAGQGPLAGLVSALNHLRMDLMLIACDMPLLDLPALCWLRDQRDHAGLHGLSVLHDGQLEPCFALYRHSVVELAAQRLSDGRRSLNGLLGAGRFAEVDLPDEHRAALRNVNTPEEWEALNG